MLKKGMIVLLGGILLISCGKKSYTELMSMGNEYMEKSEMGKALEAYREAVYVAEEPAQIIAAADKLGDIFVQHVPNPDSAGTYYAIILDYPDELNVETLREYTKLIHESGNYGVAARGYAMWLERYNDNPLAPSMAYDLAELYHKQIQDLIRAVQLYDQVVTDYPDSPFAPKALFSAGYVYANDLKNLEKARAKYETFLASYPKHEMVPSVQFELRYLGKSIEEIPELQHLVGRKKSSS
ncbi:MAG: tetratricopeptide repeat protein [Lentisphaeria bacterium]|nr:tetratricopeptide repeat protein [Candidatus Neomarinimicrobiota bacterium]MCF7842378.1 tetratricopeptide repeat protein [Lentisphaeria bacterium]